MAQVQQHLLIEPAFSRLRLRTSRNASVLVLLGCLCLSQYPCSAQNPQPRTLNEFRDFMANTFGKPGERHSGNRQYPAQNADSQGEVPDSAWYENRHAQRRMRISELVRGPGNGNAPSLDGPWTVIAAKREGVTPGFQIRDVRGRKYLLKFDPPTNPELATGAEIVASKFFYALGYHVPENYIVTFHRSRLVIDTKAAAAPDKSKRVREDDIDSTLSLLRKDANGQYRALASLYVEGDPLGPFLFHGVRREDPEDTIAHEHRRELRGLFVISAWLNHTDSKAGNTLDVVVEENGVRRIRHYLIDFGATLGSASIEPKSPRQGHEYLLDLKPSLAQLVTLGIYVPKWARVRQAGLPAVGAFEAEAFEPDKWKPNYPNPAFANRLPDDEFWAARKVRGFRDDEIRAIVETGRYSDSRAVEWIVQTLIQRRDKIARAFAARALPLDRFRLEGRRLQFENLDHSGRKPTEIDVQWLRFDNRSGRAVRVGSPGSFEVPEDCTTAETRCAARVTARGGSEAVTVYVAARDRQIDIVALDRDW